MKKRFEKIYVEITNICNLNCKFCIETTRKKEYMSIENFKIVISKIKNYTNLILLHIKGEPLKHPKLKEILDVCFENNILVNITTNATLLEENFETLAFSKAIRQINLSMHSITENNLKVKENVEKILRIIRKIKEKNKDIIISYRLWNVDSIEKNEKNLEILELIGKEYKIANIASRAKTEKFIELGNKIFLNQDIEFQWPSLAENKISDTGRCYALKNQLGILVNGDVVPCCLDNEGDIVLGNIFKDDLEKILNSTRSQNIIDGFKNGYLVEELCKRCGFINKRIK